MKKVIWTVCFLVMVVFLLENQQAKAEFSEEEQYVYDNLFLNLPWEVAKKEILTQENRDTPTHLIGSVDEYALDFGLTLGTPVIAAEDGIAYIYPEGKTKAGAYGNHIKLDHGFFYTLYAHLSGFSEYTQNCEDGCEIRKGRIIGYAGSTGGNWNSHLHFGLYHGNAWEDGYSYSVKSKILIANEGYGPYQTLESTQFNNWQAYLSGNFQPGQYGMIICGTDECFVETSSGSGGSYNSTNLPDLRVRNITVLRNGTTLKEGTSFVSPGDILKIRVQIISEHADCANGTDPDIDNIETDIYYKLSFFEDIGDRIFMKRIYTSVRELTQDSHCTQDIYFTVPEGSSGYRLYIKAVVDPTKEADELDEDNNWSGYEWYPVSGKSDLTIAYAALTKGRTTLREGDSYGFETIIKNIGADPAPMSTRLAYYEKKPGETTWTLKATDGTDVADLIPGKENYEYTMYDPFIADTSGTHYLKVCADYENNQPETNEDDNCFITQFEVTAYRPNFVVDEVGLTNGRTTLKLGDKFGLYQVISNIGNAPSPKGIRSGYYFLYPGATNWVYVMDDGTDANELGVNCSKYEYTMYEPFTANQVGVWRVRGKADYQEAVLELNESDNINSNTFTVNPIGPDFYIIDMYLKVGSAIIRNGGTIRRDSYVQPYVVIGNKGNSNIHAAFRVAYYVNADRYRDSDGVDANEVCVGCAKTEYVSSSSAFKLGDTGTRTYRVYIDYQYKAPELDETNNFQTFTFYVR